MCGINGFTGKGPFSGVLQKMNAATAHRGPEGTGTFSDGRVSLGHNLLSFTDIPERARQPYLSPDGNFSFIYNGEAYNYRALKARLEAAGESFQTDGDTEVIFKGLMRYGARFLSEIDGMFALAFYDARAGVLVLARDEAGMKPLYYMRHGTGIAFSSELRGLFAYGARPTLNLEASRLFFLFGYVPTDTTLVSGIEKLPPGSALSVSVETGEATLTRFGWEKRAPAFVETSGEITREKISHAVMNHTMGLKPFGLFLSGGMDSTIILHELSQKIGAPVKTYTTRFEAKDPRYNEDATLAARLTKDYAIDHHELLVTEKSFIAHYEAAIAAMEEPRYNHSVPAYWLLAEAASKDITVVLNGSGGDELFLGYPRYLTARNMSQKYARYPHLALDMFYSLRAWRKGLVRPGRFIRPSTLPARFAYINNITPPCLPGLSFMGGFDVADAIELLSKTAAPPFVDPLPDEVNALAEMDRYFWLANEEFLRTDKIIMHFSMEGRFPLLAQDVVSYANGISSKEKLNGGLKSLLRAAYRGHLPDYILDKPKTGWNAPVSEWMMGDFGNMVSEILSPGYYPETAALFDFDLLKKNELGKSAYTLLDLKRFLPIVQFQTWARAFKIQV